MSLSGNGDRVRQKPSIYPQPEQELILVQTHSVLEEHIAAARRVVTSTLYDAHFRVQGIVDRWIGLEHAVERRVKSLIPVDESLTPGGLYVGVATLTASILARNRSRFLRFSLPPVLFFISMNQFLPKTTHNLSSYFSSLERAHAPALADAHNQLNQNMASTSAAAREAWVKARNSAAKGVERTIIGLQDGTGLKLQEALGWSQGAVGRMEAEVKDAASVEEKGGDLK
ncbi:apolipo protein O-domain-containing protein [Gautieria morchelliformis]|nr:apolipo protein O-domain-containing protein [Gautieria morchelliformis]